jgi:hypothetical protein
MEDTDASTDINRLGYADTSPDAHGHAHRGIGGHCHPTGYADANALIPALDLRLEPRPQAQA